MLYQVEDKSCIRPNGADGESWDAYVWLGRPTPESFLPRCFRFGLVPNPDLREKRSVSGGFGWPVSQAGVK
jgi:hypothetical protein